MIHTKMLTLKLKPVSKKKTEKSYNWLRNIKVYENKIIIGDIAENENELSWKSRLLFKKNPVNFSNDNKNEMQLLTEKISYDTQK